MAARDYGKVSSSFWTGETGRQIRSFGRDVQLLCLYLVTGPSANMIGLYHLPVPLICHHLALDDEGALKGLLRAFEGGFAVYDQPSEEVFVPSMALYQIGPSLSKKDNRHKFVVKELMAFRKSVFFDDFMSKYKEAYNLHELSPFEGASKPLRSQEQEQEHEQYQEQYLKPPRLAAARRPDFANSPEDLAQQFCFIYSGTKREDRDPALVAKFFAEMIRAGVASADSIKTRINDATRDRSEFLWQFKTHFEKPARRNSNGQQRESKRCTAS